VLLKMDFHPKKSIFPGGNCVLGKYCCADLLCFSTFWFWHLGHGSLMFLLQNCLTLTFRVRAGCQTVAVTQWLALQDQWLRF